MPPPSTAGLYDRTLWRTQKTPSGHIVSQTEDNCGEIIDFVSDRAPIRGPHTATRSEVKTDGNWIESKVIAAQYFYRAALMIGRTSQDAPPNGTGRAGLCSACACRNALISD
jgi:hypothetical protein